jgi:hypothetical protein
MAQRKSGNSGGSSRSGGSKSGNSGGSSRRGGSKQRSGASSSRSAGGTSKKELPEEHSPSGGDSGGDRADTGGGKAQEAATGGKPMGRPPAPEPDVYVYVPTVQVGELNIDVERLEAHLALRAQVANLVNIVAGVHVGVDKVKIDLKDVDAECELKVRLENTYNILDRTLTTLDENPQVVEKLLDTADTAVQETGKIGKEATKPGGAVSELSSGVGDTLSNLGGSVGDTLSSVADKAKPGKLLGSGNGGRGGGKASKAKAASSNGTAGRKAAVAAGAAGAAGVAGMLLRGNGRRVGKGRTAVRTAAQIGKVGYKLGKTVQDIRKAGKSLS